MKRPPLAIKRFDRVKASHLRRGDRFSRVGDKSQKVLTVTMVQLGVDGGISMIHYVEISDYGWSKLKDRWDGISSKEKLKYSSREQSMRADTSVIFLRHTDPNLITNH